MRAKRNGSFTVVLDGKKFGEEFDRAWDPIFSPEGDKLLIRGMQDEEFVRIVVNMVDF